LLFKGLLDIDLGEHAEAFGLQGLGHPADRRIERHLEFPGEVIGHFRLALRC
jgi:hypothetical protein